MKRIGHLNRLILATSIFLCADVLAQTTRVSWSAFSSGFGIAAGTNTELKSSVGQTIVGSAQQGNTAVESGFLANPLLRGLLVSVSEPERLPAAYLLSQNYPNPFNPSTTIHFEIPRRSHVEIHIYNILGQHISMLVNEEKDAGRYNVLWESSVDVRPASGVYFYRIYARAADGSGSTDFVQTRKLMLLR